MVMLILRFFVIALKINWKTTQNHKWLVKFRNGIIFQLLDKKNSPDTYKPQIFLCPSQYYLLTISKKVLTALIIKFSNR